MSMSDYLMVLAKMLVGAMLILVYVNIVNRKQVSQMTPIDFLGNFILGYIVGDGVSSSEVSIVNHGLLILIGIGIIAGLNFIGRKIDALRKPILGKAFPLIQNGQFLIERFENKKNQMDLFDLVTVLRGQRIFTFEGVKHVQIENNGQVTVLGESEDSLSFIVFHRGKILKEGLENIGKDDQWFFAELGKCNLVGNLGEIFAIQGSEKGLFIIKNDGTTMQSYAHVK